MIDNQCVPLKSDSLGTSVNSTNFLRAVIDGTPFDASIVGGRYDGDETNWIRRSWGRSPLPDSNGTHALIFISCWPELVNGKEYDLADPDIPVEIGFTNRFPAEDGDEFLYLIKVEQGRLQLTHDFAQFRVTGNFAFSVQIEQADGSFRPFEVTEGVLEVGPTS